MEAKSRILLCLSILVVTGLLGTGCTPDNYQPEQPIFYSHKVHAGDNKIPCQYCHSGARRGDAAVIPSVTRCMGCHKSIVKIQTEELKKYQPEMDKVKEYFDQKKSIPWVKVHDLQDFVRFSHKIHIKRGFACQLCHGEVQTYTTGMKPGWDNELDEAPLTMGWCVTCHQKNAPLVAADQLYAKGMTSTDPAWAANLAAEETIVLGRLKDCLSCHK